MKVHVCFFCFKIPRVCEFRFPSLRKQTGDPGPHHIVAMAIVRPIKGYKESENKNLNIHNLKLMKKLDGQSSYIHTVSSKFGDFENVFTPNCTNIYILLMTIPFSHSNQVVLRNSKIIRWR